MKIGIVPKIIELYKNQHECSVDIRLIRFIEDTFKKSEVSILNKTSILKKIKLIILHGGNDLPIVNKSLKNIIRQRNNEYYFNLAQKNKIPIIGICHGAHFIAKKYSATLIKKKHIGNHKIFFLSNKIFKNIKIPDTTNSYHNYIIKELKGNFKNLIFAHDNSIEAFVNYKKKILGIIWHPERFNKFRKFDKLIIKKFYDISNIGRRTR